jgi:hypothetical protein
MVPRLRIVVERAGMGVVLWAEAELGLHQSAQEIDEGLGSIEIEKARSLLHYRVVTHTPALFVAGNVVAIQFALYPLRLRHEMLLYHRPREKLWNIQELVLVPIFTRDSIEIQLFDCLIDPVNEGTNERLIHGLTFSSLNPQDAEKFRQHRSRLIEILNVPLRVRLRLRLTCGLAERPF